MAEVSRETIAEAVREFDLDAQAIDRLAQHWQLVREWNQRTNLTAIEDDHEAAWVHYRDSLEALRVLPCGSVTDMGSGAGFPGLPIAIADPERTVMLVEPRRKRASFLSVAIARLALTNVQVTIARAEDPPVLSRAVVTRATFSDPAQILHCLRWIEPGGVLVAFRTESGDLEPDRVHEYEVRDERRYLLLWNK